MGLFGSNSITGATAAAQAKVASVFSPSATSKATSGATATGTKTDAGTITSSDFLTLLVSELKNQDPTQPTDPNAYIQQLVGVNSLQQLISINQGLTSIEPTTSTTTSS
jgi:flagellar basal-body rod modification protein FlgD